MSMKLETETDLIDFAFGAAFLGGGGGGDPYIGRLMLRQQIDAGRRVDIVDLEDVPDDAFVVPVATMGAPTVMNERIPSAEATIEVLRTTERLFGRPSTHICGVEAGGINATLPMVVGAITGLPVVDVDGMGRAFPELQMVTFGIYGVAASPVVLRNETGDEVVVTAADNRRAEAIARAVVSEMRGMAQIGLYPMSGRQLKSTGVAKTMSLAKQIGAVVRETRQLNLDPFKAIVSLISNRGGRAYNLFTGKISDLTRETRAGFSVGQVMLESLDDSAPAVIEFQNEYLRFTHRGVTRAIVPDIVTILDLETATPFTAESLRYGQRVRIMGISAGDVLRTARALEVVGPRAFGFAEDFVPIEQLQT